MREATEERENTMKRAALTWTNRTFCGAFRVWAAAADHGRKTNELQRKILNRLRHGMVFQVSCMHHGIDIDTGPVRTLRRKCLSDRWSRCRSSLLGQGRLVQNLIGVGTC